MKKHKYLIGQTVRILPFEEIIRLGFTESDGDIKPRWSETCGTDQVIKELTAENDIHGKERIAYKLYANGKKGVYIGDIWFEEELISIDELLKLIG